MTDQPIRILELVNVRNSNDTVKRGWQLRIKTSKGDNVTISPVFADRDYAVKHAGAFVAAAGNIDGFEGFSVIDTELVRAIVAERA